MLVLTQKEGEVLQLGDDIRIYIKRVKGNMVRLCIDAPREIPIVRVPATPKRKPLNRAIESKDNEAQELGLDLRPTGEALAQGVGEYPGAEPDAVQSPEESKQGGGDAEQADSEDAELAEGDS